MGLLKLLLKELNNFKLPRKPAHLSDSYGTVFDLIATETRGRMIARKLGFPLFHWRFSVSTNSIYLYLYDRGNEKRIYDQYEIRFSNHRPKNDGRIMWNVNIANFLKSKNGTMDAVSDEAFYNRRIWKIDEEKFQAEFNPTAVSLMRSKINQEKSRRSRLNENVKHNILVGQEVEKEHTDDPHESLKIALDHIKEDKKYYEKLYKSGLIDEPQALKLAEKYFETNEGE